MDTPELAVLLFPNGAPLGNSPQGAVRALGGVVKNELRTVFGCGLDPNNG